MPVNARLPVHWKQGQPLQSEGQDSWGPGKRRKASRGDGRVFVTGGKHRKERGLAVETAVRGELGAKRGSTCWHAGSRSMTLGMTLDIQTHPRPSTFYFHSKEIKGTKMYSSLEIENMYFPKKKK